MTSRLVKLKMANGVHHNMVGMVGALPVLLVVVLFMINQLVKPKAEAGVPVVVVVAAGVLQLVLAVPTIPIPALTVP
jgi:hypothetical protein